MDFKEPVGTQTVHGFQKQIVKILLWMTILSLAILHIRNPVKGIAGVYKMIRLRGLAGHSRKTFKYVHAGRRWFWDLYSPGWPSSSFNTYIRQSLNLARASGENAGLQSIVFSITRQCPLACEHCSEAQTRNKPDPLQIQDLKKIMDLFLAFGISQIQFSGGEPLMRLQDICSLMQHGGSSVDYWVLTSGHGLTLEKARLLKQAGLTGVAVSCDHWNGTEHSAFRHSSNAFSWMEDAARNARKADLVLCLNVCAMPSFITNDNLTRYSELATSLDAGFIQILEPRSVGGFAGKSVALSQAQIDLLEGFYQRMNFDRRFAHMPVVCYHGFNQRRVGCFGAGRRFLHVDAAGDVHACPFCKDAVGNCLQKPLPELLQRLSSIHQE